MDLLDKQIIRIMQDEFPLVKEPYKEFAKKLMGQISFLYFLQKKNLFFCFYQEQPLQISPT